MALDTAFVLAFAAIFIRCGAMMLSCPLYGGSVPVSVRLMASVVISLSLTPLLGPSMAIHPTHVLDLALIAGREALIGLLIGLAMQFLVASLQIAGAIADMQMGIGSAQLFNPGLGGQTSPIGQFKFWLTVVMLFLLNGHQLMFQAFVGTFHTATLDVSSSGPMIGELLRLLGSLLVLSMQIAAPVIAVTVVIDVAAGLINRAVPQTQPFLISLPAKIALGLVALSLGLPVLTIGVQRGLELTMQGMVKMLGS